MSGTKISQTAEEAEHLDHGLYQHITVFKSDDSQPKREEEENDDISVQHSKHDLLTSSICLYSARVKANLSHDPDRKLITFGVKCAFDSRSVWDSNFLWNLMVTSPKSQPVSDNCAFNLFELSAFSKLKPFCVA